MTGRALRTVSWDQVCAWRLARQRLAEPAPAARMVETVAALGGVQAQILSAAELAVGARVEGVTRQDVQAELWERRGLVKTWSIRGTLHLLPAGELPLWMAAVRATPDWRSGRWHELRGFSRAQADTVLAAVGEVLDGRRLTREEIAVEVGGRVGDWARELLLSGWGTMLQPAAYAGLLSFGPSQGAKVTFVRPDQWTGRWSEVDEDAALAEVARRYLAAYGPAPHQDLARWLGLRPPDARGLLASLGDEAEQVGVEGRRAWLLAADAEDAAGWTGSARGTLHLVPQYDTYVLGCGPRDRLVPEAARPRIREHGRGRFEGPVAHSILLLDGVVAGMWERRRRARTVELRVEPFTALSAAQRRRLDAEADRVGAFLGAPAALVIGTLGAAG